MKNRQVIHYDKKLKRFRKGGRFVSYSHAMKSSVARREYRESFEQQIPSQPVTAPIQKIEHEKLNWRLKKDMSLKEYIEKLGLSTYTEPTDVLMDPYLEMRLNDILPRLLREFKRINQQKYMYKEEVPNYKSSKVAVYYLIYDKKVGYTILTIEHKRKSKSIPEWMEIFESVEFETETLQQNLIPAINDHYFRDIVLKDVIGWTFVNDLREDKHTPSLGNWSNAIEKRKK